MAVPLNPAPLHILVALATEDLHGYGITQAVKRQSHGTYKLSPGTLYDNLRKLMDQGLVVDAPQAEQDQNETRRLYRLTPAGRNALTAEILRLESVVSMAKPYLSDGRPKKA